MTQTNDSSDKILAIIQSNSLLGNDCTKLIDYLTNFKTKDVIMMLDMVKRYYFVKLTEEMINAQKLSFDR